MFCVVVENDYPDMATAADVFTKLGESYGTNEFQKWFGTWTDAVESGYSQLYSVVE
jgi:hypothetical protein